MQVRSNSTTFSEQTCCLGAVTGSLHTGSWGHCTKGTKTHLYSEKRFLGESTGWWWSATSCMYFWIGPIPTWTFSMSVKSMTYTLNIYCDTGEQMKTTCQDRHVTTFCPCGPNEQPPTEALLHTLHKKLIASSTCCPSQNPLGVEIDITPFSKPPGWKKHDLCAVSGQSLTAEECWSDTFKQVALTASQESDKSMTWTGKPAGKH